MKKMMIKRSLEKKWLRCRALGFFAMVAVLAAGLIVGSISVRAADSDKDNVSGMNLTDQGITTAIDSDLQADPGVSAHMIDVKTDNGIVTLSGSVDNLLSQERAAKIAMSIRGVKSVVNEVKVKPSDRSDSQIRKDIEDALLRDPATDSYEVTVAVNNGTATLKGNVDSWQEKQLSASVAKGVRGVRKIDNKITWAWTTARPDSEIKADIQSRLDSDIWVDDSKIEVSVNDREVTLNGGIGSAIERTRAVADAWVTGVKNVDGSSLNIDPWLRNEDQRRTKMAINKTDSEIKQAVTSAFVYDPRVYSFNPAIEVQSGVVTLTGEVDNLKARKAAARDARNTVGVVRVVNLLNVRPEGTPSDAEIEGNIRAALKASPFVDRFDVSVHVVNQKAYLTGMADSYFEKSEVDRIASDVNGVADVKNNLSVRDYAYTNPYTYPSWDYSYYNQPTMLNSPMTYANDDWQLEQKVDNQLFWSPFVDEDQVNVGVDDGEVTLTGQVDSRMEKGAAADNAYQAGALAVHNQLKVKSEVN